MSASATLANGPKRPGKWRLPFVDAAGRERLARGLGVEPLIADILVQRGLSELEKARQFLHPSVDSFHDPLAMCDMTPAVERLMKAIVEKEQILLYGDYDVDGTVSIVVLKKAIELLGGQATFHVPHRLTEGYGMRAEVIEEAARNGVRLIVSVDTGIRATAVVAQANALGLEVIVTDHHLPELELPPAVAVLNPNRLDCGYPNKHLCGAGVALKLVQALLARSNLTEARKSALFESFLKPVAIATVADIVPLTGENRAIVQRGLSGLRDVRNPGLRALLEVAGLSSGEAPTAYEVSFRLAPRINAAGRMASATEVIELFLTADQRRATELAEMLDRLNRERQQVEADIVDAILEQCEQQPIDETSAALVFASRGWHLGVLGIVASRLVDRLGRPVFVLSESLAVSDSGERLLSGSGRSVRPFHLLEALESMSHLFVKFGGHKQAAGLTMHPDRLEEFRVRFQEYASVRLNADDLRPQFDVDAEADFPAFTDRCVEQLFALGPFGFGNASPLLCTRRAEVAGPPQTLKEGKHYKIHMRQQGRELWLKAWDFGDRRDLFSPGARLDLLYKVEDDAYSRARGGPSWCLILKDAQPS